MLIRQMAAASIDFNCCIIVPIKNQRMKILKNILIAITGLIVLQLVVALFVKKEYAVVREITIGKPKQQALLCL